MKRLTGRGGPRPRHPGARPLTGSLRVPGDKSISHRALILAALAAGDSVLRELNPGRDVTATRDILGSLGVEWEETNGEVKVHGSPAEGLMEPRDVLDCGNSGTTLRTLLAVCAPVEGSFVFSGDDSLRARPMLRVVGPLRQMGATIDGRDHGNLAPLLLRGGPLAGIDHVMPMASAQVKTALLLAGLRATGQTSVTEPAPSRDHTERMLEALGISLAREGETVSITGGQTVTSLDMTIPADLSAAAFFLGAAALVPSSDLTIEGVGLNPSRAGFLDVLKEMGADLEVSSEGIEAGEPMGSIRVRSSGLEGVAIGGVIVGRLIDEIPILAVLATQAEGRTEITGAAELRVKESDRIDAMASGLDALGARVEAHPDGLVIEGPTPLDGGVVESRGDHRVAMAFAVAGLLTKEKVTVRGWDCVETSFPGFLDTLGTAQSR